MNHIFRALLLVLTIGSQAQAAPSDSPTPRDPPEAEVAAVLGPESKVERTGPGQYVIDGDKTDLEKLLRQTLPEREKTLKTIAENIDQRLKMGADTASGVSLDAKRAQCQALPANSIPRTRCYQELEMMRDQSTQSASDAQRQRDDDELEKDKLAREIDAIDQFEKRYGGDSGAGNADKPDLFGAPGH